MKIRVTRLTEGCFNYGMEVGDVYEVEEFVEETSDCIITAPSSPRVVLFASEYEVVEELRFVLQTQLKMSRTNTMVSRLVLYLMT